MAFGYFHTSKCKFRKPCLPRGLKQWCAQSDALRYGNIYLTCNGMQRRSNSQIRAEYHTLLTSCVSAPLSELLPHCMKHIVIVFVHTFGSHAADNQPVPSLWNIHQVVVRYKQCPRLMCNTWYMYKYVTVPVKQYYTSCHKCMHVYCFRLPTATVYWTWESCYSYV
jgi:hypothetical protein